MCAEHTRALARMLLLVSSTSACAYGIVTPDDNAEADVPAAKEDEIVDRADVDAGAATDDAPVAHDVAVVRRAAAPTDPPGAPAERDAATSPSDAALVPRDATTPFDATNPGPVVIDRYLDVELELTANSECAGGWSLVAYDPSGAAIVPATLPGRRMHVLIPWGWSGSARVSARCNASGTYRDWSPWTNQPATSAGVRQVTLTAPSGVAEDLTAVSYVCLPPAVSALHPADPASWWTVLEVGLDPSLRGRCSDR